MTITGGALQFATGQATPIVNDSANLQTFSAEVRQYWFTSADKKWTAAAGNLSFANVGLFGNADGTANRTLTVDGAYDTAISGTITLSSWTTGGASIIKAGAGKLTLGNNSSLDTVSVNSGTLRLTGGTLTTTKQVSSNTLGIQLTGGTLEVAGGNISVGTHGLGTYSGGTGALNITAGDVSVAGALIVGWNTATTFTISGGTLTSGSIKHQDANGGILTIGGTGVVTTGDVFHNANGIGTDSLTLNLNSGGELVANRLYMTLGTNAQSTGNHSLNVNFDGGTLTAGASAASNLIDATPSGTSTRAINLTVKAGGAFIDTNGKTVAILQPFLHDPALGANPDGGLSKTGAGTLTLSASSNYTGGTTVDAGTLTMGHASALGSTSGQLTVNGGTLNMAANSLTVGNLTGSGGVINGTSGTRTLTIGQGNTGGGNYQGQINDGTGTTVLTKTGTGTITLSGTNGYTGATNVNGGTLIVGVAGVGSTHASSAVTVAAGTATGIPVAKLGGTGTIGGNVILTAESALGDKNGGVLAPTAAANGTKLTVAGTTTFNTGSIFEWNLNADTGNTGTTNQGNYGQLAGTGAAGTISGSGAIFKIVLGTNAFEDVFWNFDKTWDNVFSGTGATNTLASIFSSISGTGITFADNKGTVDGQGYFTFSGTSTLDWTAIPEPTSALAGLLLTAGLLRRRRPA